MIQKIINDFIEIFPSNDIYNEFSLQHELGIYLRKRLPDYKVQFERNVSFFSNSDTKEFVKKEIDIVIYNFDKSEKYAIELKYPKNGQYPETMFSFIKDIRFMEQVKTNLGFTNTFVLSLVEDKNFYEGNCPSQIYSYFRPKEKATITGTIIKPTGKKDEVLNISGKYIVDWVSLEEKKKYYLLEI